MTNITARAIVHADWGDEEMTKHTPGPWRMGCLPNGDLFSHVKGSGQVHTNGQKRNDIGISSASYSDSVCEVCGDIRLPIPLANARLIVAAPDLLVALEVLSGWASKAIQRLDESPNIRELGLRFNEDARAAIVKATQD